MSGYLKNCPYHPKLSVKYGVITAYQADAAAKSMSPTNLRELKSNSPSLSEYARIPKISLIYLNTGLR